MTRLTTTQQSYLTAIEDHYIETGSSPTIRELAEAQGVTHQAVVDGLSILEREGYIEREYATARGIRLTRGVVALSLRIASRAARLARSYGPVTLMEISIGIRDHADHVEALANQSQELPISTLEKASANLLCNVLLLINAVSE